MEAADKWFLIKMMKYDGQTINQSDKILIEEDKNWKEVSSPQYGKDSEILGSLHEM